ncbi:hypothetical protein ACFPH6_49790 [Streptomyces xiangluensis]|uniref:Transposase n=1 Tax=Streptomyces xiangluensis TaxID=2665720 RepID=A0ABV8Z4T2_9ACTN
MPEQRVVEPVQRLARLRLDEVAHVVPAVASPKCGSYEPNVFRKAYLPYQSSPRLRGPRSAMLEEVVAVRLSEGGIDQHLFPVAGRGRLYSRPVHDQHLYPHTHHGSVGQGNER